MTTNIKLIFCSLFLFFFIVFLVIFQQSASPFIIAFIISYILNPCISFLKKKIMLSRTVSAFFVVTIFLSMTFLIFYNIAPLAVNQARLLIDEAPEIIKLITLKLNSIIPYLNIDQKERSILQNMGQISDLLKTAAAKVTLSSVFIISFLFKLAIVIYAIFYILKDWESFSTNIQQKLPNSINECLNKIDLMLSAYFRGQATIALILGTTYLIVFNLIGLNYSILIALGSGLLYFIPYLGSIFLFFSSSIAALIQYDGDVKMFTVVIVAVLLGLGIESFYLTPKFIGEKIRLHPLLIMFVLLASAKLMGIIGVLIGPPFTSAGKILLESFIDKNATTRSIKNTS